MRFRYVNEIAGAFVLGGLLLLAGGFVVAARGSGWFEKERRFDVTLPPEGSFGLRPGAEVRILGSVVGRVAEIHLDDAGNMRAEVAIAEDFGRFVRTDSVALVKKTFGVAGDAFLEITRGSGGPLAPGGVVDSVPFEELPGLVEQMLGELRDEALPALQDLRGAVREYTALAAELRARDGNLQKLLAQMEQLVGALNRGEGTLGRLARDPTLAERLEAAAARIDGAAGRIGDAAGEAGKLFADLQGGAAEAKEALALLRAEAADARGLAAEAKGVLAEARGLLADTRAGAADVPRLVAGAADAVEQLPGVLLQTQGTLREIERLVRGMQGSWLFGGADPAPRPARLPPSAATPSPSPKPEGR